MSVGIAEVETLVVFSPMHTAFNGNTVLREVHLPLAHLCCLDGETDMPGPGAIVRRKDASRQCCLVHYCGFNGRQECASGASDHCARSSSVAVRLLIKKSAHEYGMLDYIRAYRSVVEKTYEYESMEELIASIKENIIGPAEAKVNELRQRN